MSLDPDALAESATLFLAERVLATLTTLRPDGTAHVVPVGFTWDPATRLVRVITGGGSRKVRNIRAAGPSARAVVCQVDGRRWLSLEGRAVVTAEPDAVAEAVGRYQARYRPPRPNPQRVAIEISVDRILGSVPD